MLARCALLSILLATPAASQTSIDLTIASGRDGVPWPQGVQTCAGALVTQLSSSSTTSVDVLDAEVQPGSLTDLILLSTRLGSTAGVIPLAVACIVDKTGTRVDALTGMNMSSALPAPASATPP